MNGRQEKPMNKLTNRIIVSALIMLAGITSAYAATCAERVTVSDAWVREVPPVSQTSALFMTLTNTSDQEAVLVSASGDVSKLVELHTHETDDKGVHRMFQVDKIVIPANGQTMLKPMSYHVMLIDLHAPLKEGDKVSVTLKFRDGSTKQIEAPVQKMMVPAMDHSKMDHSKMDHSKMQHK